MANLYTTESIMGWGRYGNDWAPYVSVGQRLANAGKQAAQLAKKQGRAPSPVKLTGRKIATTFWGQAWCDNLEAYSDYANRLPRGATYVRNGSVVDLVIKPRQVEALVAGSETYRITIEISPLATTTWKTIKQDCSASIDSLLDLLGGRLSDGVMQRLTRQKDGLFPSPREIKMECDCPDGSYCCKHLAAVMYGIGARLDKQPELLFLLRNVDHQELASQAVAEGNLDRELSGQNDGALAGADLGAMFGIELDSSSKPAATKQKGAAATQAKSPAAAASAKPVALKKKSAKVPVSKTSATKATLKKGTATVAIPKVTVKKKSSASIKLAVAVKKVATKKSAKTKSVSQDAVVKKVTKKRRVS